MKRFFTLVLALLFCLTACQKAPEITITTPATIEMSSDGSNGTITFTANRDWTARASESWVHISQTSGEASKGQVTITVRCDANTTYDDRSATITITAEDLSQTVIVNQSGRHAVTSIELSQPELVLTVGETATLNVTVQPGDAFDKSIEWSSSDEKIVTVESGVLKAHKVGEAMITALAHDGLGAKSTCSVKVEAVQLADVDLGLSVKWANMNLGAIAPEDFGDYYAWGETEPYYAEGHAQDDPCTDWREGKEAGYDWTSYKFGIEDSSSLPDYGMSKYNITDGKSILEPEDDAAHIKLGGKWRMPTMEEQRELIENCSWIWSDRNGVEGFLVVSNRAGYEGASIFLPIAGTRNTTFFNASGFSVYLSSSLYPDYPCSSYHLFFVSPYVSVPWTHPGAIEINHDRRRCGFSVRPVSE